MPGPGRIGLSLTTRLPRARVRRDVLVEVGVRGEQRGPDFSLTAEPLEGVELRVGEREDGAELVDEAELPDHAIVRANTTGAPTRPGWELVQLITPTTAADYAAWRTSAVIDAIAAEGEKLTAKRRKQIESRYPADLWQCLTRRTSELQKDGWSQPPGSRALLYERPQNALTSATPSQRPAARARPRVECALLALASNTQSGEVLPLMQRCLPQAELLHRALVSLSTQVSDEPCPELTGVGTDGRPLVGHRHAHYLPLDLDEDGRLDHFLIHAPMGLGDVAHASMEPRPEGRGDA